MTSSSKHKLDSEKTADISRVRNVMQEETDTEAYKEEATFADLPGSFCTLYSV